MKKLLGTLFPASGYSQPMRLAHYVLLQSLLVNAGLSEDYLSSLEPACDKGGQVHLGTEDRKAELVKFYIDVLQAGIDITTGWLAFDNCEFPNPTQLTIPADLLNNFSYIALTGGASNALDSIDTVNMDVGTMVPVIRNGGISFYRLTSGNNAEASPTIIRPDDYNATSNQKVWTLTGTNQNEYSDATVTATIGAVTINKMAGTAIIAAGATSVVVTNSKVTANSIIHATPRVNDAAASVVKSAIPGAGSFTIHIDAAAAANMAISWSVINPLT